MIDYYTMESVRDYLIVKGYEVRSTSENSVSLPSWNRCPCRIQKSCERRKSQSKCVGYVSIFVNTDKVRWLNLEICFFREKGAFIRTDCLQMMKLFELGIIANESLLKKETF